MMGVWQATGWRTGLVGATLIYLLALLLHIAFAQPEDPEKPLDPGAWGSDHVGKEVPDYMTGGECLFCHGKEVGVDWQKNRHQVGLRPVDPSSREGKALATAKAEYLLGHDRLVRYLRKGKGYGKLDLHPHHWDPHTQKPHKGKGGSWDTETFAKECAGCHTTGVDAELQAFSALSIDCYACHGDADPGHTKDASLMLLSKKRTDHPRVVASICASCHIRTGTSRSTGLPYPNTFVPGDNLFRDFKVSFAEKDLEKLNPIDRHIQENVRDIVIQRKNSVTCLTCHDVHNSSTTKHEKLAKTSASCATCHESKGGKWSTKSYEVHSTRCRY